MKREKGRRREGGRIRGGASLEDRRGKEEIEPKKRRTRGGKRD